MNDTSPYLAEFEEFITSSCEVATAIDTRDGGEEIDEESIIELPCYLESKIRTFHDASGRIQTSASCVFFLTGLELVTIASSRFRDPDNITRGWLRPLAQEKQYDDQGQIAYCEVYLP